MKKRRAAACTLAARDRALALCQAWQGIAICRNRPHKSEPAYAVASRTE